MQLQLLEELFGKGIKNPSALQIQHITSQLRRYGKIEGKNVFYWFQNHKARERKKHRLRHMEETASSSQAQGWLKEKGCEAKETKMWASTSKCNGGGHDFQEYEKQGKCQYMDHLMNISSINIAATNSVVASQKISQNIHLLSTPQHHNFNENFSNYHGAQENNNDYNNNNNADSRTLELFPIHKNNDDEENNNGIITSFSEWKSNKFCANSSSTEEIISCHQFF
ncbi:hypothetical protein PIB30_049081 [Stylosanthes scabra]|uniref:Homeobox domain-containing protein n=1 Tax=Stylosanthes scabra TaxID=79078 RepID=A0ABU6QGJ4_9FABA|nr:hypothetical protein [Stylosanthes scabra]